MATRKPETTAASAPATDPKPVEAPPGTVAVYREGGSRPYHFIDQAKYDANPKAFKVYTGPALLPPGV